MVADQVLEFTLCGAPLNQSALRDRVCTPSGACADEGNAGRLQGVYRVLSNLAGFLENDGWLDPEKRIDEKPMLPSAK